MTTVPVDPVKSKKSNVPLDPVKTKGAKVHLALVVASTTRSGKVGLKDLVIETGLTRKQCLRVMDKLTRQGYLIKTQEKLVKKSWDTHGGRRMRAPMWKLNAEKVLDVRKVIPRRANTLRDRIWRAIRIKRSFTPKDLVEFVGLPYDTVVQYLDILEHHKVIHRKPNMGKYKEYLLLTDPGPLRPVLREIKQKTRLTQRREDAEKGDSH